MWPDAFDAFVTAAHFARTRWQYDFRYRAQLEAWQQRQLRTFLTEVLPKAERFRRMNVSSLEELPFMDKSVMMDNFQAYNTRGVTLAEALPVALRAEESRDFAPMLGDLTVGLSSGTSGNRGVFLVSRAERLRWAGILLARALPQHLLKRLVAPWQAPLRIAFFLRANSNLYTTLASRRIDFVFYDLLAGVADALPRLNASQPDVLVAPPSVLRTLAAEAGAGRLAIRPAHVISVAEVLEDADAVAVEAAFGVRPHQLYQATEGFLGYTCERGTLHLNEHFVHVEPDWIDAGKTRFQPIVTDFTRETQLVVRYRLNDILRVAEQSCTCGRSERSIAAIEGRADEVLRLPGVVDGRGVGIAIYPDFIRRAMLLAGPIVEEFSVAQQGMTLRIALRSNGERSEAMRRVSESLTDLWQTLHVQTPSLEFTEWQAPPTGSKRRRVRLLEAPEGLES